MTQDEVFAVAKNCEFGAMSSVCGKNILMLMVCKGLHQPKQIFTIETLAHSCWEQVIKVQSVYGAAYGGFLHVVSTVSGVSVWTLFHERCSGFTYLSQRDRVPIHNHAPERWMASEDAQVLWPQASHAGHVHDFIQLMAASQGPQKMQNTQAVSQCRCPLYVSLSRIRCGQPQCQVPVAWK